MGKALNYLGIARMSGNIETGEENTKALVKEGKARLLILASDASEGAKRRAENYVYGFRTAVVTVPFTKEEISGITGRPGCSMAAIRDLGLAKSFAAALCTEYGEAYSAVSAALDEKLERLRQRKEKGGKSGNGRNCK